MKVYFRMGLIAWGAIALSQSATNQKLSAAPTNADPIVIILTDPDLSEAPAEEEAAKPAPKPAVKTPEALPEVKKKKTLDDTISEIKLSERQQRIVAAIEKDQKKFVQLLEQFVSVKFNPNDDEAVPEFSKVRDEIVRLTFKSGDTKTFESRLYLINASWLAHQSEVIRYGSLNEKLQAKWLSIEDKRRHIQSLVMTGMAVLGTAVGGVLSYKASTKIFEMSATTGTWEKIAKLGGRVPIVIFGAYVGAIAGRFAGFLGTEYLMGRQRDFLNPIDGTEDLTDLLADIERL
ncbi:MAG: hypothetical protein J0L93_03525 [Deltaproteobacteria bacterium]|nr:hypothetical protein [Deltaproteobacteria bacterium]